jgi:hypothetical protein
MKSAIVIGILAVVLISCFSGCVDEKSKFIGTWQTQDGSTTMTFDTSNIVMISGSGPLGMVSLIGEFNYSLANQKITFSAGDIGITLNYSFPQSNQLILSNDQGVSVILTKM